MEEYVASWVDRISKQSKSKNVKLAKDVDATGG